MKKILLVCLAAFSCIWVSAASAIKYNGATLELNEDFVRSECGTAYKSVRPEISGMACSRQTPGYIWYHGDENADFVGIEAIKPSGTLAMTLKFTSGTTSRDDWEDICTGVYNGKNYVFVGAIGDNDCVYKDNYVIYYFEEPSIVEGTTQSIAVNKIIFGFPDNKGHNVETLMYDPIDETFYIVDKVEKDICTAYSLEFKTDYTGVQKLTQITTLGQKGETSFDYITAGDITPDGKWMIIKNKVYALLWERQGDESISETIKRQPQQIAAYVEEAQGESVAWLDNTTFYTTSDQKKDVPIYKYVRPEPFVPTMDYPTMEKPLNADQSVDNGVAIESIVFTASGTATDISVTGLPAGLTSQKEGLTITISGTPTESGTYTVTAVNEEGGKTKCSGKIEVVKEAAPTISKPSNASQYVEKGKSITPIVFTASGTATDISVTGLPAGLTSQKEGLTITISGTPTASGTYTISSVNSEGEAATQTGTISIGEPAPEGYIVENFDDEATTSSPSKRTQLNLTSGDWYVFKSKISTDFAASGTQSMRLNYKTGEVETPLIAGTQTFSFNVCRKKKDPTMVILVSTDNGATYSSEPIYTATVTSTEFVEIKITISYDQPVRLKFWNKEAASGSTDFDIAIDDFTFKPASSTDLNDANENTGKWYIVGNTLSYKGVSVDNISIIALNGGLVTSTKGDSVNIGILGSGSYVAIAKLANGEIVSKKFIR